MFVVRNVPIPCLELVRAHNTSLFLLLLLASLSPILLLPFPGEKNLYLNFLCIFFALYFALLKSGWGGPILRGLLSAPLM